MYMRGENYAAAQEVLNESIKQNPYCGDLYYFLAKAEMYDKNAQIRNLKKALENYKNLTISPEQIKNELKLIK